MVIALLPAFLAEIALYLLPAFDGVRASLAALPRVVLALLLTAAAIVPYTLAATSLGAFHMASLLAIAGLAAAVAFCYALLKPRLPVDLLFLALIAAVFLSRVFRDLYPAPSHDLPLEILGRLAWIHTGVIAVLCLRGLDAGFGFVPRAREWRIGLLYTVAFVPVGLLLGYFLRIAHWHPLMTPSWRLPLLILGRFLGVLWVLALTEEFFVRGFLQQILARSLRSDVAGIAVASVVFGALHLPFGTFPNWRFAILAAVAGVFYGAAFAKTRGIRAPMVMHALVVTTWQLLFNGRG
jgi:membrane protease YdiL (CAAX protease family)